MRYRWQKRKKNCVIQQTINYEENYNFTIHCTKFGCSNDSIIEENTGLIENPNKIG
jgi:hypothetical protein